MTDRIIHIGQSWDDDGPYRWMPPETVEPMRELGRQWARDLVQWKRNHGAWELPGHSREQLDAVNRLSGYEDMELFSALPVWVEGVREAARAEYPEHADEATIHALTGLAHDLAHALAAYRAEARRLAEKREQTRRKRAATTRAKRSGES